VVWEGRKKTTCMNNRDIGTPGLRLFWGTLVDLGGVETLDIIEHIIEHCISMGDQRPGERERERVIWYFESLGLF
jgi:hypothetical protein